jgi:ABC-type sugar transport system substrate-binding protein
MRTVRVRRGGTVAVLAGAALLAAACSSASAGNAPAGAAGTPAAASAAGGCPAAAARVAAAEKPAQLTLPAAGFDMAKNKGKTVWFISLTLANQFSADLADGFQAAATAAGLKPVVFDGQAQVTRWNQGISEAVNQHAAGIVLYAVAPSLVSGPLAQAAAAHIPVVDTLNGSPGDPLPNGITAHATLDYFAAGATLADYTAATSGCSGQVLYLDASSLDAYHDMLAGFKQELPAVCPKCRLDDVLEVNPATADQQLPTLASTAVARYPQADYLVTSWDAMVPLVEPSLEQAGRTGIHVISHDGQGDNLDQIASGSTLQTADVSDPLNQAMGWYLVDQLGRAMAGVPTVREVLPQQLFVKANLPASPAGQAALFPGFAGYQAKWLALWGIR